MSSQILDRFIPPVLGVYLEKNFSTNVSARRECQGLTVNSDTRKQLVNKVRVHLDFGIFGTLYPSFVTNILRNNES